MRADRLLSLLMILQARGRAAAPELARLLGVSQRTIYRDIDSLCLAGVPIYATAGIGGGFSLVDSYRTTLTGLTSAEARALFLLAQPATAQQLGLGAELASALRKLSAALPPGPAAEGEAMRRLIHVDPLGMDADVDAPPFLALLQHALLDARRVRITRRLPSGAPAEQVVEPYGLVSMAGSWHVVYALEGRFSSERVATLLDAHTLDEHFSRDARFDLVSYWVAWRETVALSQVRWKATVRVGPLVQKHAGVLLGASAVEAVATTSPEADGWRTVVLTFGSLEEARARLLACGGGVEVLQPRSLRDSVVDYAEQIVSRARGGSISR